MKNTENHNVLLTYKAGGASIFFSYSSEDVITIYTTRYQEVETSHPGKRDIHQWCWISSSGKCSGSSSLRLDYKLDDRSPGPAALHTQGALEISKWNMHCFTYYIMFDKKQLHLQWHWHTQPFIYFNLNNPNGEMELVIQGTQFVKIFLYTRGRLGSDFCC